MKVEHVDKGNTRVIAQYGFNKIGDQKPYFAITGEVRVDNRMEVCGCVHDEIQKNIKHLKPLIKWHLCDYDGTPMHYIANSIFWFEQIGKEKNAEENFKSTCVFGVLKTDKMPKDVNACQKWLESRLPRLQKAFKKEMKEFGVS